MAYNRKQAQTVKSLPSQVEEAGDKYETEGDKILDKTLEKEREGNADTTDGGTLPMERQLDAARTSSTNPETIIEKRLDEESGTLNTLRSTDGEHPMDYHQKHEAERKDRYNRAKDRKLAKRKMDEIAGEQKIGPAKKIVNNVQPSQLLSNYATREKFEKANPSIKKAMSGLLNADAMLYHIFRTAADQNRPLDEGEAQAVIDIEASKARKLAEIYTEAGDGTGFGPDELDSQSDEQQEQEEAIKKDREENPE